MLKNLMRPAFANGTAFVVSLAAFLFLFAGHLRFADLSQPHIARMIPEDGGEIFPLRDSFVDNAVFSGVLPPRIAPEVLRLGSWIGGDANVGKLQSAWFRAVPAFAIQVAGYPKDHGCDLYIEGQSKTGALVRIEIPGENPTEVWRVREISWAAHPEIIRFRIVGIDNSREGGGWIGVSAPFRFLHTGGEFLHEAGQLLLEALTACAALVALLFPGLWWRRKFGLNIVWLAVPGFLLLAAIGLLCWVAPPHLSVRLCAQIFLAPLFAYALYHAWRFPLACFTTNAERRVLGLVALLLGLCVSYTTYSPSARGELFSGRISRTFQVSDRSDSRIPYHVFQLIANHAGPYGALAQRTIGSWGFSARTPLAALAASPVVLTLPVHVPDTLPDQAWTIFDQEGFAAFRIVMMALACCSLISVFGLARVFLDEHWALLAFAVTATAPFVVHEVYFTWPKLEAASFLLLACFAIMQGRAWLAGLLWGLAYLCHPLALVFAPALLGVSFCANRKDVHFAGFVRQAVALTPGLALCLGLWYFVNRHHFSQSQFLIYFTIADGRYYLGPTAWLISRWNSLANTLIPLYLFVVNPHHPSNNAWFGEPPRITTFYTQYWNTLPFGVGITYFLYVVRFLAAAWTRARAWLLLVLIAQFLFFTVYWGFSSAGMLREGLQPWVLGVLLFSVVMWQRSAFAPGVPLRLCQVALLLRGAEMLLMMLHPALSTGADSVITNQFYFSDIAALTGVCACAAVLYWTTFRLGSQKWNWESNGLPLNSQSKATVR